MCGTHDWSQSLVSKPCQRVFNSVRQDAVVKQIDAFKQALWRAPADQLGPELSFEQARTGVLELAQPGRLQARCLEGVPVADLRQTWEIWRRSRLAEAKENFQAWLKQCGQLCKVAE